MGPRYLQAQIHSDYTTGLSIWSGYRDEIKSMYDSSTSTQDFNDHLIREYNRKINRLNQETGLYIAPFDGGFRFIGDSIIVDSITNELLIDLAAYWKLDEPSGTRYDSHGSFDLTEEVGIDSETPGILGAAAVSNSVFDDGRTLKLLPPLPYDSAGESWSLSFWMSTNGSDDAIQVFPNAWGQCCIFTIVTIDGEQIVRGQIWKDGENGGDDGTDVSKSGTYTGGYVHVTVTHDLPTKTVRVYYNGIEEHVVTYNNYLNSVSGGGGENSILSMFAGDLTGSNFAGPAKLDEVGIWRRVLTANEVTALYNNGDGLTYEDFTNNATTTN